MRATVLAALCALAIAAELRTLLEPTPAWPGLIAATAALVAIAWLLRLVRRPRLRLAASALVALAVPIVAVARDIGRWPLQEDLRGPDGYLGPMGYLADAGGSVQAMARAWVGSVFPVAQTAEPHAAGALLALGLVLALVAVVAVGAFRAPLPAILAVATATTIGTLFAPLPQVGLQAALLVVLAVALLLLVGDAPRGRGPLALGAVALVAAVACLAGPVLARDAGWDWRTWSLEEPPPVGVGFVWDQSLQPIRFTGDPVPVLRVDRRDAGYLRVEVLTRFDGVRWGRGVAFGGTEDAPSFPLPDSAVAQAARVGERAMQRVRIRNLQLQADALPLPVGTVRVGAVPAAVLPAITEGDGVVRLGQPLAVGAQYTAEVVRVPATPELLDADVLGAPLDPALAVVDGVPSVGRHADGDPVAPWSDGADQRAAKDTQPGPYGPRAPAVAAPITEPAPLDVSFAGITFPGFGTPGREREVQRLLDDRIALGGLAVAPLAGWREAYGVARRVTAKATTPYEAAVLLESWFHRTSTYDERASYTASPIGPLPAFLLSASRRGHCQYFAGSMAVLLRMLGIPARVAAGFTQGAVDGGGRLITNRNAHVWVEVRFPYAGWVPFEPTPGRTLPSTTSSTSPSFARSAAGVGGGALATIVGRGSLPGGPGAQRGGGDAAASAPVARQGTGAGWRIALGLLVAGALVALVGALVWLRKRRAERAAFAMDDPDLAARALRDAVGGWLLDQGAGAPAAGVAEVAASARRLYGIDAAAWTDALIRAGYAPTARRETRAVLDRMRARTERRGRLRGAVRPRR